MHRWIEKQRNRCLALILSGIGRVSSAVWLRKPYQRWMVRLVADTGLFDQEYYTQNNPDVIAAGVDPVFHYVAYGDREHRLPMPLFDPFYYRRNADRHPPGFLNTLVHYSLVGRFAGIATSPWFDTSFYLSSNRDVKFKGVDPLLHFLKHGGSEGRSPGHTFDTARYLLAHPEIASTGINPLLHHLNCATVPADSSRVCRPGKVLGHPNAQAPTGKQWHALQSALKDRTKPVVDVIVPVYKGTAETLRCLFNVLRYDQRTPFELVVIDDACPDERLSAKLEQLRAKYKFTLLKNKKNLGYVRSVNIGMNLHPDRDVVLLNADTQPVDNWLDRLRQAAENDPRIGTVTPLSNNATICSYPVFDRDNPCPIEISSAAIDRIAREVNAGCLVEAPTAVGFCMYIKRACLDDVGLFDDSAFELGYGEENDFCQRAVEKDWKNAIAPNIFIWHWGARSFKGLKGRRIKRAIKVLKKRHPNYLQEVSNFVAQDPLLAARRRIDEARLFSDVSDYNVLIVKHNRGGGTDRTVRENARRLRSKGASLFYLTPLEQKHCARISSDRVTHLPNLSTIDFQQPDTFFRILRNYRISEIHIHQLIDFGQFAPSVIATSARGSGPRLEVFIHDYQSICPRINLVNSNGIYCGEPEERHCNSCIKKKLPGYQPAEVPDIRTWRRKYGQMLTAASTVHVPNRDVKIRLRKRFSDCRLTVTLPETIEVPEKINSRPYIRNGNRIRIVVVGAIVPIKGYFVLKECAREAQRRGQKIEFVVMGYTKNDKSLSELGVRVTGRYNDKEGVELLRSLEPDLVWLPSIWPETYSYTLSLALLAGFDIAAFDLGAIARRLRAAGRDTYLQPLGWAKRPARINRAFLEIRKKRIEHGSNTRFSATKPVQVIS